LKIVRKPSSKNGHFLGWILILLLIILVAYILIGDPSSTSIRSTWNTLQHQFNTNNVTELPTLTIDMDFEMYNQILAQRQEALDSGVFIGGDADFVPADITLDGETVRVHMRLQQGPASHLSPDDKWNFEIRTDEDQPLLNMTRAQLIDPADNNWLHEWAYQQTLIKAGILATPITFVELMLNGDNRGIYALQTGFDANLPTSQGKEPGIIVEFDPTLIWQNIAYFDGDSKAALADPVTNLSDSGIQFLEVDTFRDAAIARDDNLSSQKEEAIEKLRAFQRGELTAAELFDLDAYAQFLALSDLWGASDATSLLNLRFFYNAETGLLEPIGFNGNPQLENGRVDMAAATFNDPDLQTATIQALQAVTDPAYLADLEASLANDWETWQRTLSAEANITPPWSNLAQQQANIQRSLQPQQPIFTNFIAAENTPTGVLQLEIGSVVNLPVEIIGLDFGNDTYLNAQSGWVISGPENVWETMPDSLILKPFTDNMALVRLEIPLTDIYGANPNDVTLNANDILIESRIIGTDGSTKTAVRPGFSTNE